MTETAYGSIPITMPDLQTRDELLHRVLNSASDCIAVVDSGDAITFISDGGLRLLGTADRAELIGQPLAAVFRPLKAETAAGVLARARAEGSARFEAATVPSSAPARWWDITLSAMAGTDGEAPTPLLAIARDITGRKRDDEHRELLTRELSHRIQNIFAVVTSLISVSARAEPTALPFADKLKARLSALWQAHDYVRPGLSAAGMPQSVHGLAAALLAAYPVEQIRLSGDDCAISPQAASALALILHELATNAVKYGALSNAAGRLQIRTSLDDDDLALVWAETGGPAVSGPPSVLGFGSTLASRSAGGQLGGAIHYDWRPEGLAVTLRLARAELEP